MISTADLNSTAILSFLGPIIVGLTFIWSGGIKAIAPHVFRTHLGQLGWIPWKLTDPSVVAAAALETGWGLALLLRTAPRLMIPVTIVALVVLSAISWWGVRSGRATDCGCYGGYVVPSIGESVAINAGLILLLLITPPTRGTESESQSWKIAAAVIAALASGIIAWIGLQTLNKKGKFFIDMSPLKVGREWRSRWGTPLPDQGEHLVSFLGPECPHCKQWVRVLNAMYQMSGLPKVSGVVGTTNDELEKFVETSGINFPMHVIPKSLMNRLVYGVPTTVMVADGRIVNTWSGHMPPEFYQRFRDAFFPPSSVLSTPAASAPLS